MLTRITTKQINHNGERLFVRLSNARATDAWTVASATSFPLGDDGPAGTGILVSGTQLITLGANATIAPPATMADGQEVDLIFLQDATGGRTVTFSGAAWKVSWANTGNTSGKMSSIRVRRVGAQYIQIGAQMPYI